MTDVWDSTTGTKRFGDKSGGHYTEIESDGSVIHAGDATMWDDLLVQTNAVKLPGVSDPSWTAYKGSYALTFAKAADNVVTFAVQLPHGWKVGSDLYFHLHLAYPSAKVGSTRWIFTHSWANIGSTFPAETTVTTDIVSPNEADNQQIASIATLTGTGKTLSSVILCSVTREGTHLNDDYDDVVYVVSFDFHTEKDTMGSRQAITK